jgi:glycosyltransferase involved in cell wall biosynthesis
MEPHFALCFEGRVAEELRRTGAPVHSLGPVRISRPWLVLRGRRGLRRLLTEIRFDAVVCHSCWPHALFGPAARQAGLPVVFWGHGIPGDGHWLDSWAARTTPDLVIANSRATGFALARWFPRVPKEVLYCPVPAPGETGGTRQRLAFRASLHTPADAVVIVMASRLERLKGHAVLLKALASMRDLPGWACWIAGGPQRPQEEAYDQELRAVVAGEGLGARVTFLGERNDIARLLRAGDIYCQPNMEPEGFGIAFIEALDACLPVVTTALGGALEIVDETCGLLVPPGAADLLAEALHGLIREPAARLRLGAGGPRRARQLCDPATQLGRLSDLLARLVNRDAA